MEQQLIEFAFQALNQIKLAHWATMSYAKHKALDDLHSNLSGHIDNLVETYIGNQMIPLGPFTVQTTSSSTTDILPFLHTAYKRIKRFRKAIPVTELQNIMDEMLSDINQAAYLLRLS
jgi:hypothetical protein